MSNDMSAEQEPHAGADQQEHHSKGPLSPQPLRLAPEGAFSGQNTLNPTPEDIIPNQYDARIGGTATGRPPFTPGTPPDVQPSPSGHKGRNILLAAGAAVAGAATIAGTLVGLNRANSSSEQGPDTGSVGGEVTQQDPVKTNTPAPTPTMELTPTSTPETATPTPILTSTPEVSSTLSQYPEKIIEEKTYGRVTIARTQESVDRTECRGGPCLPMKNIELNTEDYPDAAERLNEGINYGFYLAWLAEAGLSKSDYSFESYKNDLFNSDKDLSFSIFANVGAETRGDFDEPEIDEVTIDPRKPVTIVWVGKAYPSVTLTGGSYGTRMGYRVIDGELYFELHEGNGGGGIISSALDTRTHQSADNLCYLLSLMSEGKKAENWTRGVPMTMGDIQILEASGKIDEFRAYLEPEKFRNSILHARE